MRNARTIPEYERLNSLKLDPMCSVKERVSTYGVPWQEPCQVGVSNYHI